jgi:hypothetical protein
VSSLQRRSSIVRAVAAPERQQEAAAVAYERTLPLGPAMVSVEVSSKADEQRITVSTTLSGRLVLHWGVEGGRNYRGGWRLPGERCRPEGSINYKNRALQTPFKPVGGNGLQVSMPTFASSACRFVFDSHASVGDYIPSQ